MTPESSPHLCHRCGAELTPGEDDSYIVRIEAFADPTPPTIREKDLQGDLEDEIARLVDQMNRMPEQELMDQVHRRLTIRLCGACYPKWIENPAG